MEFKVGDRVKVSKDNTFNVKSFPVGKIGIIDIIDTTITPYRIKFEEGGVGWVNRVELVTETEINSKSLHKTMEKKVYNVLVVNKKTGKTDKNQVVTAENEQSAILKAFGVDVESVFIKIKEEGSYTEDKPVTAVLVKETKTPRQA